MKNFKKEQNNYRILLLPPTHSEIACKQFQLIIQIYQGHVFTDNSEVI